MLIHSLVGAGWCAVSELAANLSLEYTELERWRPPSHQG